MQNNKSLSAKILTIITFGLYGKNRNKTAEFKPSTPVATPQQQPAVPNPAAFAAAATPFAAAPQTPQQPNYASAEEPTVIAQAPVEPIAVTPPTVESPVIEETAPSFAAAPVEPIQAPEFPQVIVPTEPVYTQPEQPIPASNPVYEPQVQPQPTQDPTQFPPSSQA